MSGEGGGATEGSRGKNPVFLWRTCWPYYCIHFPESSRRRKRGLLRGSIGENRDTTGSYYLETHCLGDLRKGGIFIDRQTMIHDNTGHEC